MAGAAVAAAGAAQWVHANVTGNGLAVLTLDRPKALNAMNVDMDIIYKKHLDEWATEPSVKSVLIQSSSARAFCAGMDIKGVAAALQEDRASTLPYQVVMRLGLIQGFEQVLLMSPKITHFCLRGGDWEIWEARKNLQ
ncbi:hypothetical protein Mapa_000370 [Marchantia paleacea]|nr:hypothetical protein Mapa_000370 [Marchantia paleacea]